MDNQKDNNHSERENRPLPSEHKNQPFDSFFLKDTVFLYVHKKTEKLATALYMVTNLFSDSEPMKWALRKKVSDLLSFIIGYKDISPAHHIDFVHTTKSQVLEILSLLEVSSRSGLVSSMNSRILREEFLNLLSTFDTVSEERDSKQTPLTPTFFDVPPISKQEISLPQKDAQHVSPSSMISPVKDVDQTPVYRAPSQGIVFKKTNRQNIIIQLLKRKKELTIKDIAQVIKDCSEKTIQRELVGLIQLGVLKKTGERRWSKYSLTETLV